jgi:hypothetical protein
LTKRKVFVVVIFVVIVVLWVGDVDAEIQLHTDFDPNLMSLTSP